MSANIARLLDDAKVALADQMRRAASATDGVPHEQPCILFFALSHARASAEVWTARGGDFDGAWLDGAERVSHSASQLGPGELWLRVDAVSEVTAVGWAELQKRVALSKRMYFRHGLSFTEDFSIALTEQEINAHAILFSNASAVATPNEANLRAYGRKRFGTVLGWPNDPEQRLWLFRTRGVFADAAGVSVIAPEGRNSGYREIDWGLDVLEEVLASGTDYLAQQVKASGEYHYGWFPCSNRAIPTYNALRHASSTYALLEGWEVTREPAQKAAIDRALHYLVEGLIKPATLPDGSQAAFLVDTGDEIKLGGNAVCLLALTKYTQLTGDEAYLPLLERLATGILHMQDRATGRFVHVLAYPDLTIKQEHRIIYYDGEAAFGLMRLYGLTGDARWLEAVERAFDHFIAAEHWRAHDHWLGYCVNELTLHRPEARYYRFGLDNVRDHLDFVLWRVTTFPTLLELMMAARQMIDRLATDPVHASLLEGFDQEKFDRALEYRARYLLNGFFWPELAMFFPEPGRIVGSFFIRHHGFRVRIDDVEHYLSGYVAYRKHLLRGRDGPAPMVEIPVAGEPVPDPVPQGPVVAWGGDVNLGRRQHYRTAQLGVENVLRIPALQSADLRIANLECVVATTGEQGVRKGEGGPYYYRARPEMLQVLGSAGIDVVVTANNHSGDYGPGALLEQGHWLDAAGIGHAGSGRSREAALKPVIRRAGDLNVAIFSLDATQPRFAATADRPGSAYLPPDDPDLWRDIMAPRIAAARNAAHIVLVAVHWGRNLAKKPGAEETALGHALIDAGADGVLGSSAHLLRGIEIYRGRPIVHDAGDLLFDSVRRSLNDTGLFSLELSPGGVERVSFTPLGGGFGFTTQLEGPDAAAATRRFAALCRAMGTDLALTASGAGTIRLSPAPRPQAPLPAAPLARYRPVAPAATAVEKRWLADAVPQDACLDPVSLGPLTLLGLRVKPDIIQHRRMLWVETFWKADAAIDEDIRLDIRGVPVAPTPMKPWGEGMDHDPCDWLLPTSRWKPGQIYRDYYGLRPPHLRDWDNVGLQLTIGIVSLKHAVAPVALPHRVELAVPLQPPAAERAAPSRYRTVFPDVIRDCEPGRTWTGDQIEAVTGGTWLVKPPPAWFARSAIRSFSHLACVDGPALYVASDFDTLARHEEYSAMTGSWDSHRQLRRHAGSLAGAIVARPVDGLPRDFPVLQVADPIKALIELGLAARQRFGGEVIAITGTAGKSTTVGMLRHLLGDTAPILASFDNYNSRVGAPTLLANLAPDHRAAIVEIAQSALWMNSGPVTRLLKPTIALITEIGMSQTDRRIKSVQDTAKWKSRVFDGLTGAAVAVVGDHLACFDTVMAAAQAHAKRIIVFGESERATLRLIERSHAPDGSRLRLRTPEGAVVTLDIPLPGPGMVHNALAAIGVLYAMGADLDAAARTLASFSPAEGRLQRLKLPAKPQGTVDVIDDSWNATVSSMLNAISVFANTPVPNDGRKIAVLGRIVHLGDLSQSLHEGLAPPLLAAAPHSVVTHGEEMRHLRAALPENVLGPHFSSAPELAAYLHDELRAGDLVLVKGSRRDSDFGQVCRFLSELSARNAGLASLQMI